MKNSKAILFSALVAVLFSITMLGGCKKEEAVATCVDSIKNQNETGVDCGGVCAACPTCFDGIKNQSETGVDCGGVCTATCGSCFDRIQNQDETGIDCGGVCSASCATCSDGIQNQNETGIDCGGVCSATCPCPTGYEGIGCTTEMRTKFFGAFQGPETCTIGFDNYTLTITSSSANVSSIVLSNVYNQAYTVVAVVDGAGLTVANQTIATNVTISGSGYISGTTLTFTYTIVTTGGQSNTCTFTGTKI